jgi:hypothetical protein
MALVPKKYERIWLARSCFMYDSSRSTQPPDLSSLITETGSSLGLESFRERSLYTRSEPRTRTTFTIETHA